MKYTQAKELLDSIQALAPIKARRPRGSNPYQLYEAIDTYVIKNTRLFVIIRPAKLGSTYTVSSTTAKPDYSEIEVAFNWFLKSKRKKQYHLIKPDAIINDYARVIKKERLTELLFHLDLFIS